MNRILNREKYQFMQEIISLLIKINEKEEEVRALSQKEMQQMTTSFKERIQKGESMDNFLVDVFALVRESARRTLDMRHFDVQILGGLVLHRGNIAEMMTGEGKTLVATLPLFLNALSGRGCHLVTVNDYLAKRDTQWMGAIYHYLGLSVGCIISSKESKDPYTLSAFIFDPTYLPADSRFLYLRPIPRKEAYNCDITYGVASEFGFDYLRDNMSISRDGQVQRELNYAIIDEVDSILIDEARTPLIISGPAEEATHLYYDIDRLVRKLNKDTDFTLDEEGETVALTDEGVHKCERLLGIQNLYDGTHTENVHLIHQALRAHNFFRRDKEYIVKDGQVIIVDEFTGRLMPGRRWSDGLHQAIEAKEGVRIESENQTLATISFQNYFKLYNKIAGMTGTALTEAVEFKEIYKTDVIVLPPNKQLNRKEYDDEIYKTEKEKFAKLVAEIEEMYKTGRPVLVGTISIEKAERLSRMLSQKGIPHKVLHGKNHEAEAAIIAQAGKLKAVTIATQMAGRGVDIILGGNPEILAREETIRVIWSKKRAEDKGTHPQKEFAEVLTEIEKAYKERLADIDNRYKPLLQTKRQLLNEKEQLFFALDKKAREQFEETIFNKEGGDIYQRYKGRLEKQKEAYERANEQLVSAQKQAGDRYDASLKDLKESEGRAYREYLSLKSSIKTTLNIVLDEDIEEMRNRLTELLNNPEAETEEGAKAIYELLVKYRDWIKRYMEILTSCFPSVASPDAPLFKKAYRYPAYIDEILTSGKNIADIIKEVKEKEGHLYTSYAEGKKELQHLILISIAGMDYHTAEQEYRKALQDYEKEYARYDEELKKAREEYEESRSRHEEEWQKAREELEKAPEEFKEVYDRLLEEYKKPWMEDHQKVISLGGLHVIGSERYEARRIDNQLKGRAGRQGDPGSSRFYLSLDDDLLRIFGSERMRSVMGHIPEGEPIAHPLINRMITNAQKKVEARNFEIRKQLLEFDNVLNEQRKVIYALRQDILEGKNLDTYIGEFIEETIQAAIDEYMNLKLKPLNWDMENFIAFIKNTFDIVVELPHPDEIQNPSYWREQFSEELTDKLKGIYETKKKEAGQYILEIQKIIMLQVIDNRWKAHLRVIDELREGIGLRAYAQRDPLLAYKHEGYQAFQEMLVMIKREVLSHIFRVRIAETPATQRRVPSPANVSYSHKSLQQFDATHGEPKEQAGTVTPVDTLPEEQPVKPVSYAAGRKIGRNEPCPCGSGKKYKKCCGKNV
ncbi:MAG: preprotein translocase subunit SecA [Candidatus Ratteibacteria bacterium]|nr:preprotein translocase subunit SecA [Candidatus Ratteibacteria bacterium]